MHGVPTHRSASPLRRLISLLGVFALLIAAPALAEKRVALVIGNAAYKHAPALANPKNDAEGAQRVNIIILDSCRDNPLARSLARSMGTRSNAVGRGLAPMTAGLGTLMVYATAPGHRALDGDGKNAPFTAALLKHIATPKLEIRELLTRVRQEMFEATKARPQPQIPWDTSSLMASFYLPATPEAK